MPRGYGEKLRRRLIETCVEEGLSARAAGRRFGIGVATAVRWMAHFRATGEIMDPPRKAPASPLAPHRDWLLRLRRDDPEMTLAVMANELEAEHGLRVTRSTLSRFFAREGVTFKKTLFATEQDRGDVALARWLWRRGQGRLDPKKLVFIDEMGAATDMTPQRGWWPRGERLVMKAPHGHWRTTTFVAGLRHDRIVAPLAIPCPMNGAIFRLYVERFLLRDIGPGDIVIMDNLASHKNDAVRDAIEGVGAELLFLPPYSPDLNPIEQAFAKLKHLLRKAARRTVDDLWDEIGRLLDRFSPQECRNYLSNSGY